MMEAIVRSPREYAKLQQEFREEIQPLVTLKVDLLIRFARPVHYINMETGIGHSDLDIPLQLQGTISMIDELIDIIAKRYREAAAMTVQPGRRGR